MKQKYGMRAKAIMIPFVFAFALVSMAPQTGQAAQDANGFCQSYLVLGELSTNVGGNPSLANARLDYVQGPGYTEISLIPQNGLAPAVNFGLAASTGWQGSPNNIIAPAITGDWADFSAIYTDLDNLMTYAWTYVEITGSTPLETYLGIATDDTHLVYLNGIEVGYASGWHNNRLVDHAYPAVLLPNRKNLLMVKVFEGGGGHNVRLRFQPTTQTGDITGQPPEGSVTYTTDHSGFTYPVMATANRVVGISTGEYVAGVTLSVTITVTKGPAGNPVPSVDETVPPGWTVSNVAVSQGTAPTPGGTMTWNVGTMFADTATMTYDITAAGTGIVSFSGTVTFDSTTLNTTGDSQMDDTIQPTQNSIGMGQEWVLLGHYVTNQGSAPGAADMREDYLKGGGVTEANFVAALPALGVPIASDYSAPTCAGFDSGNAGFAAPTPFLHVDGNDTVDFNNRTIYGDRNDVMNYAWCIARCPAALPNIYLGIGSDDSIMCFVNGAEVGFHNGGRGFGGQNPGEVQNAFGPFNLNAGDNIIMLKIFEGGGGFGFRCRLQTDTTTGNPGGTGNMVPLSQAELLVTAGPIALADREIDAPGIFHGGTNNGTPSYQPGLPILVTLTVERDKGIPNVSVVETLPTGWVLGLTTPTVGTVTPGGGGFTWDVGFLSDNNQQTLVYEVTPDLASLGDKVITGDVMVGSENFPVWGDALLVGLAPGVLGTGTPSVGRFDWAGDIGEEHISQPPRTTAGPPSDPSIPGSTVVSGTIPNETYTVSGAGSDFWGSWDRGQLVSKAMSGGFLMEADVAWTAFGANPNDWAKAGIMIRSSINPRSPNATELIRNPEAGPSDVRLQWRENQNGGSGGSGLRGFNIAGGPLPTPYTPIRLRIVRMGNVVQGYFTSGTAWVFDQRRTVDQMDSDADVLACLFVTSHRDNDSGTPPDADLNTAVFGGIVFDTIALGKAERSFDPPQYTVGEPVLVSIDMTHQINVPDLNVVEVVPAGWGVTTVSDGGVVVTDAGGTTITWTLDFQADIVLTYEVWPVGGAATSGNFSGTVYEPTVGDDFPIGGVNQILRVESNIPKAMVAWWPLDDGLADPNTNTISDVFGNYNGTRERRDSAYPYPQWVTGIHGGALQFDNSGGSPPGDGDGTCPRQYGNFPDPGPPTYLNSRHGTMSTWFWTDNTGTAWRTWDPGREGHMIYGTSSGGDGFGGNAEIHINMNNGGDHGRIQFFMEGNNIGGTFDTTIQTPSSTRYDDGAWHHVVGTWDIDQGFMRLYVDGVRLASGTHPGISFDCSDEIRIARPDSNTRYYGGLLDDVRIYNYALTNQEVFNLFGEVPDPASVRAPDAPTLNDPPTVFGGNNVQLSWTNPAGNTQDGFIIQRMEGTTGVWIDVGESVGLSFIDWLVTPLDEDFTYRVRAFNNVGDSANSNEVSAHTVAVLRARSWHLYR